MRQFIAQKIGLPLFDKLKKRNLRTYYATFKKVGNTDKKQIEDYQLERLQSLLAHAYKNVPFYHERMDNAGLKPDIISSLNDLKKLPTLKREDLQTKWTEIIATNFDKKQLSKGSSSGSTGVPVVYYKDAGGSSAGQAANFTAWALAGWKLGKKGLHIWGNPSTALNEWKKPMSRLKTFFYNHYKYPAYQLTNKSRFDELVNKLNKGNFDFIDGYTNAIYLLAEYLKENNLNLKRKLNRVITTAENLQDFQRETIEEKLGPIYDNYGCSEINGIANECRHCCYYHIIDPHVIVEYGKELDSDGSRELIITDLDNYGFPLIRYQNDDAGIPVDEAKTASCVVKYNRLKKVTGRQSDMVKLPGGGTLTVPSFFGSMLLKQVNGIKQYQIIRESENMLIVQFVTSDAFRETDEKIIENSLQQYLGDKIGFEIRYVDEIEASKTGKFKLLIDKTI